MQTIPFPEPGKPTSRENLRELKNRGMRPPVAEWASREDYFSDTGGRYTPPGDGGPGKYWRDVSRAWNREDSLFIFVDRENPRLTLRKMPQGSLGVDLVSTGQPPGEGFSHHVSFGTYGLQSAIFLNDHTDCYGNSVARLKIMRVSATEAYRLELQQPVQTDFPVAYLIEDPSSWSVEFEGRRYKTSWPRDWFLAFNEHGQLDAVPVGYIPERCKKANTKLSDFDLVMAAEAALGLADIAAKAAAIRSLAGR